MTTAATPDEGHPPAELPATASREYALGFLGGLARESAATLAALEAARASVGAALDPVIQSQVTGIATLAFGRLLFLAWCEAPALAGLDVVATLELHDASLAALLAPWPGTPSTDDGRTRPYAFPAAPHGDAIADAVTRALVAQLTRYSETILAALAGAAAPVRAASGSGTRDSGPRSGAAP